MNNWQRYKKKILILFYLLSLGAFSFVFVGNGCAKGFSTQGSLDMSSNVLNSEEEAEDIVPGTKMVATLYSRQALDQMLACTGVRKPSDATLKMFEAKKGAISISGAASTMTPPMMMSVVSIAGEVCNDLVNQEMALGPAQALIFKNWNFQGSTNPSSTDIENSISKLALSCWGRNETNDEKAELLDAIYPVQQGESTGETKAPQAMALMLCTLALSSLDGVLTD